MAKRAVALTLVLCLALCVLFGCSNASSRTTIEYDAKTQTLYVKGADDFASLSLPEQIKDARVLNVQGEDIEFQAYLSLMRTWGFDEQAQMPDLIDRSIKSIRSVRQYLKENAGSAYPSARAALPVSIRIDSAYGYQLDTEKITIKYNEIGTHRGFLYLLALMDNGDCGWEQFGYAWYVGVCFDPYTEVVKEWPIVPELPYYPQCIAAGIDPENVTPADYRKVYDACARVCLKKGLTHWGSYCESTPVTEETGFIRKNGKQPGDSLLTAFTAASFLAWLEKAYGFEAISLFCFGQKSFEEAFDMTFSVAYKNWSAWITDTYPAD